MSLTNIIIYLDSINPPLKEVHKQTLSSMAYDAYMQGIEEGKQEIKNKLVDSLLLLLDSNK